jgi:hypothetical protein
VRTAVKKEDHVHAVFHRPEKQWAIGVPLAQDAIRKRLTGVYDDLGLPPTSATPSCGRTDRPSDSQTDKPSLGNDARSLVLARNNRDFTALAEIPRVWAISFVEHSFV